MLIYDNLILNQCKPKLILPTIEGIISAVESKLGIAIVNYLSVKKVEDAGLVKTIKIKGLNLKRDLVCIYRDSITTTSPYKEFIDFIKSKHFHFGDANTDLINKN
jgi:DNA-binding transcriptional LysR family regulator